MRYFFIDLENVKSEGLEGVLSLGSDDNVVIFYSENAMNLTIPALENLNNSKASKKFIKTNYIGKNAMDFQIVSLFGAMIERNRQGSYYIISQDNGFRSAVSFCESYFESYHPLCGVHPTIIAAITDELKKSVSKSKTTAKQPKAEKKTEPKAEQVTEKKAETKAEQKTEKKTGQKAEQKNKQKAGQKTEQKAESEVATESAADVEPAAQAEESPSKKKRRRRKKSAATAEATETIPKETDAGQQATETAGQKSGAGQQDMQAAQQKPDEGQQETKQPSKLAYIYDVLGELLSQKTIDIYAKAIDEGIATSSNRDELHSFFMSHYGEDEGEALYKVMQSDFDTMKQARPGKASRSRHRGHRGKHKGEHKGEN